MNIITQLFTAFLGSLGFALMFGMRRRHLLIASLGGMFSWGIYLAVLALRGSVFFAVLAASAFSMIYAEVMAKFKKCPETLFIIIAIIPLVPGSSLYYAMSYAVGGDMVSAKYHADQTIIWVLAISAGISFITAIRELRRHK